MKAIVLCFCFGFAVSLTAQTNLENGLIRSYPFSGSGEDFSSSNDDATVSGPTLTSDRFGNPNSAYLFDGINDIITFNPKGCHLQEFSYSIWAYIPDNDNSQEKHGGVGVFALMYIGSTTDDHGITTGGNGNEWTVGSYHDDGSMNNALSNVEPDFNEWHHLVLTRTPNSLKIYVDGVLADETTLSNKTAGFRGNTVAVIGARPEYYAYFKGKLDDVRVYSRALSGTEVNELYSLSGTASVATKDPAHDLKLYPNPVEAGQELNLLVEGPLTGLQSAAVYSLSGHLIKAYSPDEPWIVGVWNPGTYILRIETDKGPIHAKFILIVL